MSEFIFRPWKHAQEVERERARLRAAATNPTPSVSVLAAADTAEEENTYVRQQVNHCGFIEPRLIETVRSFRTTNGPNVGCGE